MLLIKNQRRPIESRIKRLREMYGLAESESDDVKIDERHLALHRCVTLVRKR